MSTASQQVQTCEPSDLEVLSSESAQRLKDAMREGETVIIRNVGDGQYDVIRDGRHVGTVMDTADWWFTAHAFSFGHQYWGTGGGMRATRKSLSEAVTYILERSV